jgi:hypothetical protein
MRIPASPSVLAMVLATAACFLSAPTVHAQRLLDQSPEARIEQFDRFVLGEKGASDPKFAQTQLEGLLARRLAALDRIYHLSEPQKKKLKLAGQGDISRLFGRIDAGRNAYMRHHEERVGKEVVVVVGYDVPGLKAVVESGPFGEDSLLGKVLKTVLTKEQVEREEQRRLRAARSTKKITIDNLSTLETAGRFRLDAFRIAWRPNSTEVGLFALDKALEIRSADDFRPLRTTRAGHKVTGVEFSPKGDLVAIGDDSTKAFLVNLSTGKEIALEAGNRQPTVAFSPDGKLLATGGHGQRAILWSAESGERIATLRTGEQGELTPVFSPDGKILAVGNRNSSVRLFDVAQRRLLRVLPGDMSHELKFDPTGTRLAIAFVDGSVVVWNVSSGELLGLRWGHDEELHSLDWSPNAKIIATSGVRAPVTLWRAADLKILKEIECPICVTCVRFNPEGTRLVYAGGSETPGGERFVEVLAVP